MTVAEASRMFGLDPTTIYKYSNRIGIKIRKQKKRCSQKDIAAAMEKVISGKNRQMIF